MHVVFVETNPVGLNALRAAREAGHRVTFLRSRRFAGWVPPAYAEAPERFADRERVIESPFDEAELEAAVLAIRQEEPVDALVTVLDFCVQPVTRVARRLGFTGTDPAAAALAQDKAACRARIEAAGLASLAYGLAGNFEEAAVVARSTGYPLIAKPRRGVASVLASRIADEAALRAYFATLEQAVAAVPPTLTGVFSRQILLEAYAEGPLFSVEIAAAAGEVLPVMVSARKRCQDNPSIELGTTMPAPVPEAVRRVLCDYAVAAVRCLGLDLGVFHVEVILTEAGPVLVEVNPRIMGGNMPTLFRLATGRDLYLDLIAIHHTGRLPEGLAEIMPVRAAATRMIGVARDGRIAADLDRRRLARLAPLLAAWQLDVEPGQPVQEMRTSAGLGYFQVVRDTPVEASLFAEWVTAYVARAIGVELKRATDDYLLL